MGWSGWKKPSACKGCPYGAHQPCIGWCTRKIIKELQEKRTQKGRLNISMVARATFFHL